jgi:hypothetical protein
MKTKIYKRFNINETLCVRNNLTGQEKLGTVIAKTDYLFLLKFSNYNESYLWKQINNCDNIEFILQSTYK